MSRSVDLFIHAAESIDELASALGRLAGAPLVAEPDGTGWQLQEGEVRATLAEHPYRDDGDLLFSRYRFALSAILANDVRPHDTAEAALLRRVAQQIQRGPAWPILLVHDLQYRDRPDDTGSVAGDGVAPNPHQPAAASLASGPPGSAGAAPPPPALASRPAPAVGGAG